MKESPSKPFPSPSPAAEPRPPGPPSEPPSLPASSCSSRHVLIPKSIVEEGSEPWRLSLVGKFLGRALHLHEVQVALAELWQTSQEWEVFPMSYGYFIFRFTSQEDKDRVLLQGPWVLDDAVLALGPWSPEFCPSSSTLPREVLWLRLPDLPPALWSRSAIELILGKVGRLI